MFTNIKTRFIIFSLSIFFVLFSFIPSIYELSNKHNLQSNREFVLEHNYMFDYNFYLSRIRQGSEGRWLISEKYFDEPHGGSLFQIVYLYMGKVGSIFFLDPTSIYHIARVFFGFVFLVMIGSYCLHFFKGKWVIIGFLLIVTASSFPIPMIINGFPRFGTYMGWWSAIDSLQRITFLPHILIGQIGLLFFIRQFSEHNDISIRRWIILGILGFFIGLVFPPTLIIIYVYFFVLDFMYIITLCLQKSFNFKVFFIRKLLPQIIFVVFSFPIFFYLQLMFAVMPWKALALFDVQYRIQLDYVEYILALGPVFFLGTIGIVWAIMKRDTRLYPPIAWVFSVFILFRIFEYVPQQSPSRFTEALLNIPFGILSAYLFWQIIILIDRANFFSKKLQKILRVGIFSLLGVIIFFGLGVMVSMVFWLTDQAHAKRTGTYTVPLGTQIVYPLTDFMKGIYYLRDNTEKNEVVLAYITAGNYIPAYSGNFVYLGHANTPDEPAKEGIAARFFKGQMSSNEAKQFLKDRRISYVYFGIQEKELGGLSELLSYYPYLREVYVNSGVTIYRVQ